MRRGRPRHDEVLTPREWQVLDLLREGLTNDQIAARLGISYDTAKFHVSEILGKLEVQTREEAAAWQGRPKVAFGLAPLLAILQRLRTLSAPRLAALAAIAVAAVALLTLAAGTLIMQSRGAADEPVPPPEAYTGNEALDALIDTLLHGDLAAIAAGTDPIDAREGLLIGGPVGMYAPRTVPAVDWQPRLAVSQRELHAVVIDPREPFPWWDQPPQAAPRAAIFDAPRDFDVVFVVAEPDDEPRPWRFSLANSAVIDIVIGGEGDEPGPSPPPLVRQLGYLTPSPDDEPASFLVLPREDMRPPPFDSSPPGGAPGPRPAPVASPSFAPDGRTGDSTLDALIESLLKDDDATLAARFAPLVGSQRVCDPSCTDTRVSLADWTARLASASRSLYAVYTGDPADAELLLAVDNSSQFAEAWRFQVRNNRISALSISVAPDPPFPWMQGYYHLLVDSTPSPPRAYERFYVLPPLDQLPATPGHHQLSTRTGVSGVDALLSLFESRDAAGLIASLAMPDSLRFRHCGWHETSEDRNFASHWATETMAQVSGLHAVARLPDGYQPQAGHILILLRELNPLLWEAIGILEADGRIIGVLGGQFCRAESMYPPAGFIVPPPPADAPADDTTRRSGVPIVDAILDAAAAGDTDAMAGLIVYQAIECADVQGIGAPPGCPPGAAPGTPVEVFPSSVCHGEYATPDQAPATLIRTAALPLFAVVAVDEDIAPAEGPTPPRPPIYLVVLAGSDGGSVSLTVGADGVTYSRGSCGAHHPQWLVPGVNPDFLLAPP